MSDEWPTQRELAAQARSRELRAQADSFYRPEWLERLGRRNTVLGKLVPFVAACLFLVGVAATYVFFSAWPGALVLAGYGIWWPLAALAALAAIWLAVSLRELGVGGWFRRGRG
jgi:hypothetical protein